MAAFFIGSLGMIGIPPTGGFISKWYLVTGAVEAKEMVFLAVLLVSAILNAAYFLPVTYTAFFEKATQSSNLELVPIENVKEVPMVAIPLVITAVLSLILGLYPDYFLELARTVMRGTGMS